MKKTALNNVHHQLQAKMVSFGGFEMPISYTGIKDEHLCVRKNVGVFDVSHMGEFFVQGPNAISLLQRICSNDISKLKPGKAQYNYLPNTSGGIVDDLIVYQLDIDHYLLVVNASNINKDWAWINSINQEFQAKLTNASDDYSLLAVQGPKAMEVVQKLTDKDLSLLQNYTHCTTTFADVENVLVATTGYTGAGGVEIYCANTNAKKIWDALFSSGETLGIQPIGLAARDTLRLEMGYCLYGNEIDDTTSPIAAGLGWVTHPTTEFINAKAIALEKNNGVEKILIGFELIGRGIPRTGYAILDKNGTTIGRVSSGTQSPSLNKAIGLGYVPKIIADQKQPIYIEIRDKQINAQIVELPFYKK